MAELVPIPLPLLVRRAFLEYQREGKIFDLPRSKFFRGFPDLDLSVDFHGHRASTPLGPAAGPHGQLAQNIVLAWLGGSRIIELKTVQILDELKIPRPCIDATNVGYNVEWSQELKLEQSLEEYVGAAMFLEILKVSKLLGEEGPCSDAAGPAPPSDTVFDMSVGYNLEGIRSPRVRSWIASMKNAAPVIDKLRAGLGRYRDLDFPTSISDTISLSTFHGCPAGEIEGIVAFLLVEMGCHVCIKLNPTLLGQQEVAHLLHDVLGYREIRIHPPAFENDLQFDEAADLIPRLRRLAQANGRGLSVKFTNTLVVKNHRRVFTDDLMYMSGAPLHVIALNLARRFRERIQSPPPMSFSGGMDAHNVAAIVALNFVPATTCTDLLRPGGYGRLHRYLENLAAKMRELGVTNIPDYVARHAGQEAQLVERATADPRYSWERNKGVPRKIGSKLWLYDCINCDKCVPDCPNDANFVYETPPVTIEYDNYELTPDGVRAIPGGVLRIVKAHQLANYADACNDCGNCDIFCPEDGGPQNAKPRFFGSLESYRKHAGTNGFYLAANTLHGTLDGRAYVLEVDRQADRARFEQPGAAIEVRLSDGRPIEWQPATCTFDALPFLELKILFESVTGSKHVNFVNTNLIGET
jgi:putative selenate reductase